MKNILIVCADKNLRKDISKALATELKCLYVDIDEMLDYALLNQQEIGLQEANEKLHKIEQKCIARALEFKGCVITISHDLFVANDNFYMFDELKKIFVSLSKSYFIAKANFDKHRLEQELIMFNQVNNLVADKCDNVVDKDVKSIKDICQEIINIVNV